MSLNIIIDMTSYVLIFALMLLFVLAVVLVRRVGDAAWVGNLCEILWYLPNTRRLDTSQVLTEPVAAALPALARDFRCLECHNLHRPCTGDGNAVLPEERLLKANNLLILQAVAVGNAQPIEAGN